MLPPSPGEAWSALAHAPWGHVFEVAGAELLGEPTPTLDEDEQGYLWGVEAVWRTQTGLYLFSRVERRAGAPERRTVVLGADPAELVVAVRGQLGLPPGRVEALGRAGIEVGLSGEEALEGDELEGPLPE